MLLLVVVWLAVCFQLAWGLGVGIYNPKPTFPSSSLPYAPNTHIISTANRLPPVGTLDGIPENRRVTFQAADGDNRNMTTGGAIYVAEMFTNKPSCNTNAVTYQCQIICTPWAFPHTKSDSCTSVPHTNITWLRLNPSDISTVRLPEWSVGIVTDNNDGTYTAQYWPELKGGYDLSVMLAEPGGLYGLYYDNVWFLGAPSMYRVDPQINFQWGVGSITAFGADFASIRWAGKVRPDHSEQYTFFVNADEGARLWIDRILIIDSWSALTSEKSAVAMLRQNFMHDIILEYKDLTGNAYVELRWSSNSTPKAIIPMANLYVLTHISGSPFMNVQIGAGDPGYGPYSIMLNDERSPGMFPVLDPGFRVPTVNNVGDDHYFLWRAFDVFGNVQDGFSPVTNWSFVITGPDKNATLQTWSYAYDIGNATYKGVYNVKIAGYYVLHVKLNGVYIINSPWTVYCSPTATYSPLSAMWGRGVTYAMSGQYSDIIVQARDRFNNNRTINTDYVQVIFTGPPGSVVTYTVDSSSNDGFYQIKYQPQASGQFVVQILLNRVQILNSPFNLTILSATTSGPYTITTSPTNAMYKSTSMQNSTLRIASRDIFNNPIVIGGANVTGQGTLVNASSPLVDVGRNLSLPLYFNATVVDNQDGYYSMWYIGLVAGNYSFSIKINGEEVQGSPFACIIYPSTIVASSTVVIGSGLSLGYAGTPYSIFVRARDLQLNNLLDFQIATLINTFTMYFTCAMNTPKNITILPFFTQYYGNSTFWYQYVPQLSTTDCHVNVLYNDASSMVHVPGSPFLVTILPGPSVYSRSHLSGNGLFTAIAGIQSSFVLTAFDQYSNYVSVGGVPFFFNVSKWYTNLPNINYSTTVVAESLKAFNTPVRVDFYKYTDLGAGFYRADYVINKAGNHSLNVYMTSKGSLHADYYSDAAFTCYYSSRIEPQINFSWGFDSPFTATGPPANAPMSTVFPTDSFSVIWKGQLLAPTSEITRFYFDLCSNVGAELLINGVSIIKAMSVTFGTQEPWAEILLTKNMYYDIMVLFRADTGNASISLSWSSASRPKSVIDFSYFYYTEHLEASPYLLVVNPAPINATRCVVITNPLPLFIVGIPATILIQARDQFDNNMWNSSSAVAALFSATLSAVPIANPVVCSITAMANGIYNVTFIPVAQNQQVLSIMYNGVSIGGLPLNVSVQAGLTNPRVSTLVTQLTPVVTSSSTAPPLTSSIHNATAGTWNWFIIESRDVSTNLRPVGGDLYSMLLVGSGVNCSGIVADMKNGLYNVTYRCPVAGQYSFQLYLNKTKAVANTPYAFTVVPAIPFVNKTYIVNGAPSIATANSPLTFTVATVDKFGNAHTTGGNNFVIKCTDNYGMWVRGTVTDLDNGRYTISTTLTSATTQWQCFVMLVDGVGINVLNGLVAQYYDNRFLDGVPSVYRIDSTIDFNWGLDLITPEAANYVSAQWTGFIKPAAATAYTFYINADDSVRLYVNNLLIIDTWKLSAPGEMSATYTFPIANMLYDIVVQYKQAVDMAFISLQWSSATITKQVIPTHALFTHVDNVLGSPFVVQT